MPRELLVVNKIDAAGDLQLARLRHLLPDAVFVSARRGDGIARLRERIAELLPRPEVELESAGALPGGLARRRVHAEGEVLAEEHTPEGTLLRARVGPELASARVAVRRRGHPPLTLRRLPTPAANPTPTADDRRLGAFPVRFGRSAHRNGDHGWRDGCVTDCPVGVPGCGVTASVTGGREERVPIVTGYEDTPGGHDALVLGAQLTRLTGLGAIVATVYPTDGRGLAAVAHDPRWLPRARKIALVRFARARSSSATAGAPTNRSSPRSGPARSRRSSPTSPTSPTRSARRSSSSARRGTGCWAASRPAGPCSGCCQRAPVRWRSRRAAIGIARARASSPSPWSTTARRRPTAPP